VYFRWVPYLIRWIIGLTVNVKKINPELRNFLYWNHSAYNVELKSR